MSVIFQDQKIGELAGRLKWAIKHDRAIDYGTLFNKLSHNKDFTHEVYYSYPKVTTEEDVKNFALEWVDRRFWEILIANLTAYTLQYEKEKIGSFYDYVGVIEKAEPIVFEKQKCIELLSSIDYNLSTNDGNRFLSEKNEQFIRDVKEWLNR